MLPEVIWAAPKVESNIYFANLLFRGAAPFSYDITCPKGMQLSAGWTLVPSEEDCGDLQWAIEMRDVDEKVISSGETCIRIAKADAGAGQSVRLLLIGDSLTKQGFYSAKLLKLFNDESEPNLTLLGSKTGDSDKNRHEGHAGWTWARFISIDEKSDSKSPFLFQDRGRASLDFSRYIREVINAETPDFIIVFLGTNDIFGCNDQDRVARISKVIENAEEVVKVLQRGAPLAKIGLITPLRPASQDAFGFNYGCGQTRNVYIKNLQYYGRKFHRAFKSREDKGIYLIPTYLNFDADEGYPSAMQPVHGGSRKVRRQTNALHPSEEGSQQIADTIYAWIKNMLSE